MRIVAFITQATVIDQILTHRHMRATAPGARSLPSTRPTTTPARTAGGLVAR